MLMVSAGQVNAGAPDVDRLFACPLEEVSVRSAAALRMSGVNHRGLGVALRLPKWLALTKRAPRRMDFASSQWLVSIRRTALTPRGGTDGAKKAYENYELGPSHRSARCERAVLSKVLPVHSSTYRRARFGAYRRVLAQRRRVWAMFLELPDGTVLSATITGFWKRSKRGPKLDVVANIFAQVARAESLERLGMDRHDRPLGKSDKDALH